LPHASFTREYSSKSEQLGLRPSGFEAIWVEASVTSAIDATPMVGIEAVLSEHSET